MITIRIDKSNKCNGDYSLYISFTYDVNIVNIMRNQIIRYYNPDTREWELPVKNFNTIVEQLKDYQLNIINLHENAIKDNLNEKQYNYIPKNYAFKIEPFKHQVEGIEYGLKYDKFLLGDEQGLGKTMQAINIAVIKKQQKKYKHCLIICGVNGLKWNWKAEVEKHSDERAYILGTRMKKDKEYIGNMQDRLDDLQLLIDLPNYETAKFHKKVNELDNAEEYTISHPYFLITNIETLRNEDIIKKLKELCDNKIINMIVLDERSSLQRPKFNPG